MSCHDMAPVTPCFPSSLITHSHRTTRRVWCSFIVYCSLLFLETKATADDSIRLIVEKLQAWQHEYSLQEASPTRPYVTLSFAQSLDGKLAVTYNNNEHPAASASSSSNYPLSGPESLRMTHALRSAHDGILIGGKTLAIDNPRLTNRLWRHSEQNDIVQSQPRPIVLDTHLTHVLQMAGSPCRLQRPILCCSPESAASLETLPMEAQILACACRPDGKLDLVDVLHQLYARCGIRTLMVEGGADVLSSFLEQGLFDVLCVTVAPKLLGKGLGLFESSGLRQPLDLVLTQFVSVLGKDIVLVIEKGPVYHNDSLR